MSECYIVLGPPRTGTSLTMGVLAAMGIWTGDDFRRGRGNPCYYEDRDLYKFINAPSNAMAVVTKLATQPKWGFKHPRVLWLWDKLEPHIESPHFVVTHRRNVEAHIASHRRQIRRQTPQAIKERTAKYYEGADKLRARYPVLDVWFEDYFEPGPRERQLHAMAAFCGMDVTDKARSLIDPRYRSDWHGRDAQR